MTISRFSCSTLWPLASGCFGGRHGGTSVVTQDHLLGPKNVLKAAAFKGDEK